MRTLRLLFAPLLWMFVIAAPAQPRTSAMSLESRLIGRPIYLRGMWQADRLQFDHVGRLLSASATAPFTLCGIDVTRITPEPTGLVIEGRRMGLQLESGEAQRQRVPLRSASGGDEPIHIEIAAGRDGDYNRAVQAIFANGLGDLVPSMPSYWQYYAHRSFAPGGSPGIPLHSGHENEILSAVIRKGRGTIQKPTLAHMTPPRLTEAARRLHYNPQVIVNVVVGRDGNAIHPQLIRPAGLGLDERAIEAVQHAIFHPALQGGRTVPVDLNVVVSFARE